MLTGLLVAGVINILLLHLVTVLLKVETRSWGRAITAVLFVLFIAMGIGWLMASVTGVTAFRFLAGVISFKYVYKIDWLRAALIWGINFAIIYGAGQAIQSSLGRGGMMMR